MPMTNIPRATWRRPVIGASTSNNGAPPLVDRAALHRRAPDLEAVLDDRVTVAGVFVDVRHRVEDELHLAADDDVDDGRALLADLRHHAGRESGRPQRPGGALGGDELAPELDQA